VCESACLSGKRFFFFCEFGGLYVKSHCTCFLDVHGLVQLSPEKSWDTDREHRGRLQEWPQTNAAS